MRLIPVWWVEWVAGPAGTRPVIRAGLVVPPWPPADWLADVLVVNWIQTDADERSELAAVPTGRLRRTPAAVMATLAAELAGHLADYPDRPDLVELHARALAGPEEVAGVPAR